MTSNHPASTYSLHGCVTGTHRWSAKSKLDCRLIQFDVQFDTTSPSGGSLSNALNASACGVADISRSKGTGMTEVIE
jgi:hypothetical protein